MQPRNPQHSGAQGVTFLEGSSAIFASKVEGIAQPAGCSTTARAQEDRPDIWEALPVLHRPVRGSGERGEPQFASEAAWESEGRIRAMTLGNRRHLDPGEQRRPVRV